MTKEEIQSAMFDERVQFTRGLVDRHFTKEWSEMGAININKLPQVLTSILEQRKNMIDYIEALHDKIDWILEKNNCCDMPSCLSADCTSDHK